MSAKTRPQDYLAPGTSGWMEMQVLLAQVDALIASRDPSDRLMIDQSRLEMIKKRAENITCNPERFIPSGRFTRFLRVLFYESEASEQSPSDIANPRGRLASAFLILFGANCQKTREPDKDGVTWADLYSLQEIRIRLMDDASLKLEMAELRANFQLFAGPVLQKHYRTCLAELKPSDQSKPEDLLRAEAMFLLEQIQHIQSYRPHQERRRLSISCNILTVTLGLIAVCWLACLAWLKFGSIQKFPIGLFLILSLGALGAAFSSLQRIQNSFKEGRMIINSTRYMRKYKDWLAPPITGAVFAFIACLLYHVGLFQFIAPSGELKTDATGSSGLSFLLEVAAGCMAKDDFIKTLLVAFTAGFAERLVPDTLDRLTSGKTPKKSDSNQET